MTTVSKFLFTLASILLVSEISALDNVGDTTLAVTAKKYNTSLTELTDREYPNNPDKKYRSKVYTKVDYNGVSFSRNESGKFHIEILPKDKRYPKVTLQDINLMEFIPSIPNYVKKDDYLSLIAVVNQEWNRNQITFKNNHFSVEPGKKEHKHRISRVDIARSCLNSYLWEVYFYTYNPLYIGKHELMYHGWFEFPKELYRQLFYERNQVDFTTYAEHLEDWKDLPSKSVNLDAIRSTISERQITFEDVSDEMYPLEGERKKKRDEVLYPRRVKRMTDFHTDRAKFSSFVQPGMYVRKEKRLTQLSRFQKLEDVSLCQTSYEGHDDSFHELRLKFVNDKGIQTHLIIGGLDIDDTAIVIEEKANDGDLYSMGFGNHTFYENYNDQQSYSSLTHPYFGVLLDDEGKWLDSHAVGIDGPLIHRDAQDQDLFHVWLLSYERHALIGHYKLKLR